MNAIIILILILLIIIASVVAKSWIHNNRYFVHNIDNNSEIN